MIRIFLTGAHDLRTPFSYPALTPLWSGFARLVTQPADADLYLFAHIQDIKDASSELVTDWRQRQPPVVLLSEEPFWDSIWTRQPLTRPLVVDTEFGPLPVIQLNHHTSTIFDFDQIPYYLLSDHRFANAYAARFTRNAALTPDDWQAQFSARTRHLTFMFERRPEPFHNLVWGDGDLIGLCAWRTELAQLCRQDMGAGTVDLLGQSWQGGPTRFEIGNWRGGWHRDKLTRLDGHARMIGALENTHQPNYLSEKLFDAFACGAWPLYYASRQHRVHGLGLPQDAWANLFGLSPQKAATQVSALTFTPKMFTAYAEAQKRLARLFATPSIWTAERRRLATALRAELEQVLDTKTVP